jgi:Tol biopolymer transport system component
VVDGHGGTATGHAHVGVGTFPPDAPGEVVATVGGASTGQPENAPAISSDGRFVAFVTAAALVPQDTNGLIDVYVFDRGTRVFTRVSVASDGSDGNGTSERPSLSADGRYIVFESDASNLVTGDSNDRFDIFRHDRVTGETLRVSVASDGGESNGVSFFGKVSDDGNLIAFASSAFNLVANDANGASDIFVRNVTAGTTTRISVTGSGGEADLASTGPAISGDGRFVAFGSIATNLVGNDTNNVSDVFVRDRALSTTTRVSVSSTGLQGDRRSVTPAISSDGRFVSFLSDATNLVPGGAGSSQLIVRDLQADTTTSNSAANVISSGQMSADGRYITAFRFQDTFIRDRFAAVTSRPPASNTWLWPSLSGSGRYVVVLDIGGKLTVVPNPL